MLNAKTSLNFVKKSQVFICRFELCCKKEDQSICACDYTSNIKPEIGKDRPVVIVHAHKRCRLAIVVPLTTQRPEQEKEYTIRLPVGAIPGVLGKKECWALCDMIQTVSLDRLQNIYSGNHDTRYRLLTAAQSALLKDYFNEIKETLRNIFKG